VAALGVRVWGVGRCGWCVMPWLMAGGERNIHEEGSSIETKQDSELFPWQAHLPFSYPVSSSIIVLSNHR
jgi:hypothetical protein